MAGYGAQQPQGLWDQLTGVGNPAGLAGNPLLQMGLGMLEATSRGQSFGGGLSRGLNAANRAQVFSRGQDMQEAQTQALLDARAEKRARELAVQDARARAVRRPEVQKALGPWGAMVAEDPSLFPTVLPALLDDGPDPTTAARNLAEAGYVPGTPEYQQAMRAYMAKNQGTVVNVGAEPFKVPGGYRVTTEEERAAGGGLITPIEGFVRPEAAKAREMSNKLTPAINAVTRFSELVDKHGTEAWGNFSDAEVAGEMGTLYQQVISSLGLLTAAGTIQPGEVERFKSSLPNPTEKMTALTPGSLSTLKGGLKGLLRSLKDAQDIYRPIIEGEPPGGAAPVSADANRPPRFDFGAMTLDQLSGIGDETIDDFTDAEADAYSNALEKLLNKARGR